MKIKPCPHCGHESPTIMPETELFHTIAEDSGEIIWCFVVCERCMSMSMASQDEHRAIESWNNRVNNEPLIERVNNKILTIRETN